MMTRTPLLEALRQPEAYPFPVDSVSVLQTHISMLFFAGDRVFKVKKAVDMGFLDYTTLEARKHFCAEEVRLNRRLAPRTYLGVATITRDDDDVVRLGGEGEVIDYAVEMKRLPAERMLAAMLERHEIDNEMLNELAALLVDFHGRCDTGEGVDEYATPGELQRQVDETFGKLEPGGPTLSRRLFEHLRGWALGFVERHRDLLERRLADGRIREGHGDLHAGNICLTDAGIVIYDCIEFNRNFRCRDVAAEMAFLAMDLDFRGFRAFGGYLLHRYAELAGDDDFAMVTDFYKLYFAAVRGMVASLKSGDENVADEERADATREAQRYFHLAASYTLGPALIVMCGLPASGKSWAARHIARPFEAAIHRSDVIRKELAHVRPDDHTHTEIYTSEMSEKTYRAMLERCVEDLQDGRVAIADATFVQRAHRAPFIDAATRLGVPMLIAHVQCDEDEIRRRMEARGEDAGEVSDADWAVYHKMKKEFEPPQSEGTVGLVIVRPSMAGEDTVASTIDRLIEHAR